jgi:hypothetical protein
MRQIWLKVLCPSLNCICYYIIDKITGFYSVKDIRVKCMIGVNCRTTLTRVRTMIAVPLGIFRNTTGNMMYCQNSFHFSPVFAQVTLDVRITLFPYDVIQMTFEIYK